MRKACFMVLIILFLTSCAPAQKSPEVQPSPELPTHPATKEQTIEIVQPTQTAQPSPTIDYSQPPYFYINGSLPGATPDAFGSAFFHGSFHSAPVFSSDMKTMWWAGSYSSATIYTSHFEDGTWSDPEIVTFSESINLYRDPFIAPDGELFFFISPDPIPGFSSSGKENIWMMAKDGEAWGEPQPLPQAINALNLHWTISVAENYDLYFSAGEPGNKNIYMSAYIDGVYTDPVLLPPSINSDVTEITPNIAPEGSYLLFTRLLSRDAPPYLFISYALGSSWSEPVQVENIPYCISPIVTPDGEVVLYLSSSSSFGWRDTSFVNELFP